MEHALYNTKCDGVVGSTRLLLPMHPIRYSLRCSCKVRNSTVLPIDHVTSILKPQCLKRTMLDAGNMKLPNARQGRTAGLSFYRPDLSSGVTRTRLKFSLKWYLKSIERFV
jgi:hypothetical protein